MSHDLYVSCQYVHTYFPHPYCYYLIWSFHRRCKRQEKPEKFPLFQKIHKSARRLQEYSRRTRTDFSCYSNTIHTLGTAWLLTVYFIGQLFFLFLTRQLFPNNLRTGKKKHIKLLVFDTINYVSWNSLSIKIKKIS